MSTGFLPNLSLKTPEMAAPPMAPTKAELANQPTSSLSKVKKRFHKPEGS